jgi:Sec-independent protein translocase protein TatA
MGFVSIGLPHLLVIFFIAILLYGLSQLRRQ